MNDEIQQPAPEQPALPPATNPEGYVAKSSIEKLPPEVRNDIDNYLKLNNRSATYKYIKDKYAEQFPHLKTLAKKSVYLYAKKHKIKTFKEAIIETGVVDTPPALLNLMNVVGNPSSKLEDKRAAYLDIFNYYESISQELKATQANFKDPQIFAVIVRIKAEQGKIIDTLTEYDSRLAQSNKSDIVDEVEYIAYQCTVAMTNSYKESHPDQSHFSEFIGKYKERLKVLFASYKVAKEEFKAKPVNIT